MPMAFPKPSYFPCMRAVCCPCRRMLYVVLAVPLLAVIRVLLLWRKCDIFVFLGDSLFLAR